MSEKFLYKGFDRIVAKARFLEKHTLEIKAEIDRLLEDKGGAWIEKYEVEKTEQEKEILHIVNDEADRILTELGRHSPPQIAESNVHVLKEGGTSDFTEGRLKGGAHSTKLGSILIDRCTSRVQFAVVLFHELMHMKSYKALQVVQQLDGVSLEAYRGGFSVYDRKGAANYLESFEEAIVGYLTQKFFTEVVSKHALFVEEAEKMRKEGSISYISRMEELNSLQALVDALWNKNKEAYTSRDEIFALFIDAQVNGNLLPVGKLIDRTFGPGTLRWLAEETGRE